MASSGSFNTTAYSGRYLQFSWSETAQSITNNTTTISWTLKGAGGDSTWYNTRNIKVTIEGKTVYNFPQSEGKIQLSNGTVVASGSYTFTHNDNGTKSFTAYAEAGIYQYAVNCKGSATFTLDTIARASQPSLMTSPESTQNVGYFGDTISIYMNRKSTAFTHRVRYAFGSVSGTCVDANTGKAATAATTDIRWKIPDTLMGYIPNSTTGSGTIYVDTYNGSTLIGTKYSGFTARVPDSVKPYVWCTLEDITGIYDIYGSYVQGLSKIKVTVNAMTAYGSPINKYSCVIDGTKYMSQTFTTGTLTNAGTVRVAAGAIDKRSRLGTWEDDITVLAYTPPKITSLSVHRCGMMGTEDEQGEYAKVNFTAAVSSMDKKNTCEYVVKYKKSSETTWTSIPQTIYTNRNYAPTASVVFAADGNSSYDVMVTATDRHGTASRSTSVSTAFTMMNWHTSGTGMAFGKVAEQENTMEIALDVEFLGAVRGAIFDAIYPVGSIYLAFNHTNPSTLFGGTWERIENRFLWATTEGGIIGNLGGESTHTLTESEMPSHTHSLIRPQWYQGDGTTESTVYTTSTGSIYGSTASTTPSYRTVKGVKGIEATGGGKAHNNMPPYIQVSAWHRIA